MLGLVVRCCVSSRVVLWTLVSGPCILRVRFPSVVRSVSGSVDLGLVFSNLLSGRNLSSYFLELLAGMQWEY